MVYRIHALLKEIYTSLFYSLMFRTVIIYFGTIHELRIKLDTNKKNSFKLKVIKFAEERGKHGAAKFFNVDRKRVREWCQNK
jgi:hypothetical protein